jgi:transposase-like protein
MRSRTISALPGACCSAGAPNCRATPRSPFPGTGRLAPQAEQIRQLQQRLRAVTEERDILKTALAYFADDQQ